MESRLPATRSGRVIACLFFAAFVGIGFGWFGGGTQLLNAARLRESSAHAEGVITSVTGGDALNNPTAYYEFKVAGATVYGYSHIRSETAGRLGPQTKVSVTYLPDSPETNAIDVEGVAASGWKGVQITMVVELVLAAIFLPLVLTGSASGRSPRANPLRGNQVAGVVVLAVMAAGGVFALVGAVRGYQKAQALVAQGRPVVASITAVYDDTDGGGRYAEYSFSVDGAYYHGKAMPYRGGYGDRGPISVTYLPDDPSFSSTSPQKSASSARGGILFVAVWLTLLGAFACGLRYSISRSSR